MSVDSEARVIGILTQGQDKMKSPFNAKRDKSPLHSPNAYSQSLNGDEEDPVQQVTDSKDEDVLPFLPYQKGVGIPKMSSIDLDKDKDDEDLETLHKQGTIESVMTQTQFR